MPNNTKSLTPVADAIRDGQMRAQILASAQTQSELLTVQEMLDREFAKSAPVSFVTLEANGIIEGGLIVVRGEREFELIRAHLSPAKPSAPDQIAELRRLTEKVVNPL